MHMNCSKKSCFSLLTNMGNGEISTELDTNKSTEILARNYTVRNIVLHCFRNIKIKI